jgi:Ser/Thr protein kinase RdoA (MazF antagonist)
MSDRKEVCKSISDGMLKEAASRFGTINSKLIRLHESVSISEGRAAIEKALYQCEREGKNLLLRLTMPQYVNFELIPGEADWINYLADNGVRVPRVIPSEKGNLVEIIQAEDSSCAAVSLEKVEGKPIDFDDCGEWNAELFAEYGRTIGEMHSLSKRYAPTDRSLTRMQWHEQEWLDTSQLPPKSPVRRKCKELIQALHTLPKDRDSYGLIHGDAHPWNVLLHEGKIVLTDFDFCEQSWFASDIAIILFYAVMAPIEGMDRISFTAYFTKNFMRGYREENSIDVFWSKQLPSFLRLRMISKYILHYPEWTSGRMSDRRKSAFMEWKRRIENDIPYLEVDFSELV